MEYRYKRWIFPVLCTLAFVMATVALVKSCTVVGRVVTLERHRDYMFEVVRERAVSKEWCEKLNDDRLLCSINANRICRCRFYADDQDAEFKLLQEEIARRVDAEEEALKAAAQEPISEPVEVEAD